jgi:hypothetical protein
MFNTGDVVRWRNDGSLEIFGRKDDQVKIKVSYLFTHLSRTNICRVSVSNLMELLQSLRYGYTALTDMVHADVARNSLA